MEIALGEGKVEVNTLTREGRIGLLLRPQSEAHEVGEWADSGGEEYFPENHPDHVVVWLDKLESARILQDTVNEAVLKMQGIPRGHCKKHNTYPAPDEQCFHCLNEVATNRS